MEEGELLAEGEPLGCGDIEGLAEGVGEGVPLLPTVGLEEGVPEGEPLAEQLGE